MTTKIIFTDEEFLNTIQSSNSHSEAMRKLGYKTNISINCNSYYSKFLKRLNPDLSHFGNFSEKQFLQAVKSSSCHSDAGYKLGYKSKCGITSDTRYSRLFKKLQPDISHFCTKYNISHPAKSLAYKRQYHKVKSFNDIDYKLRKNLRSRFKSALKLNYKSGSAVQDLGCSIEKFKLWMEMHWSDGMTWDNYGEWHIDHSKPLSSFNLKNREELLKACHFTNLKPMWAEENLQKSNKF